MEITNFLNVKSRDEFREWLIANHDTAKECWLDVKRGEPKDDGTFRYVDAVEEAMCFGWIDSTVKKLQSGITAQRFAPRKPDSQWSELNKARCRRMEKLGRMTDAGRAVYPDMAVSNFVIDKEILSALQADEAVWKNFNEFPPLYRRVRIDTIQIKKSEPELFKARLNKLIDNTRQNIMYGKWNDNGRLTDTDDR